MKLTKAQRREIKVTPSCGCVFCDIGLTPDGPAGHFCRFNGEWVECRRAVLNQEGRGDE